MNFEVRVNKPKRMKFVRILSVCMLAFLLWFMHLPPIWEMLEPDGGRALFYALAAVFALLFFFSFYAERRPRIVVDDLTVTFCPRWGRTRTVTLADITSRIAQIDRSDPRSAAVSAALGGGLAGCAAAKILPTAPPAMIYTYFSDGRKLITIHTREMENAETFDKMVTAHLDREPVPSAPGPAAQPRPAEGQAVRYAAPAPEPPEYTGRAPVAGKSFSAWGVAGIVLLMLVLTRVVPFLLEPGTNTPDRTPSSTAAPEPESRTAPQPAVHSAQGVSFEVPGDWVQAEQQPDMFYTADHAQAYGLNGVSPLGSYTPQVFSDALMESWQGQFSRMETTEALTEWRARDGVACYTAGLTGYAESVLYCMKLIIAPQKNLVLTFCGQSGQDDPEGVWNVLNELCASVTFTVGAQDDISGNTFLCPDGSELCLADDGSFRYYQSAEDHTDAYYEGLYEVYRGQAAIDKIASMTEYGLTADELEMILSSNMDGYVPGGSQPSDYLYSSGELEDNRPRYSVCPDTFYAVILNNQRLVYAADNIREGGNSTLYLGFYLPELHLADLTNANAASHTQWVLQEENPQHIQTAAAAICNIPRPVFPSRTGRKTQTATRCSFRTP